MLFAVVWHWWLGFFLSVGVLLAVVAVILGYFIKVASLKRPKKQ